MISRIWKQDRSGSEFNDVSKWDAKLGCGRKREERQRPWLSRAIKSGAALAFPLAEPTL